MTPAVARAALARHLANGGTPVQLIRQGEAPFPIMVKPRSFSAQDLAGGAFQGNRILIIPVEPLEQASWPLPIGERDQIEDDTGLATIIRVDAITRRLNGVLIAYEVEISG